ncbi:hypothetical protein DFP72DRAFT_531091 [Ephemerocybe angulata]|uniref:Secreted protein n=1 Tax=Ephemerocybe angulata TaxID=980116 RepID=A0A8H6MBT7_9AGAR|nr:hypothetical protein DFP72DRAFT_531091 [Tulosesus angulatus]
MLRLRHSVFCVAFPFIRLARLGEGILLAYKASRGVCSMQDIAFPNARDTTELTRIFGCRSLETFLLRLHRTSPIFRCHYLTARPPRPRLASAKQLNLLSVPTPPESLTHLSRHSVTQSDGLQPAPARQIHFCCDFIKSTAFFGLTAASRFASLAPVVGTQDVATPTCRHGVDKH